MLPTTQEYKIALMIGEDSFRTLQNLQVIPHPSYPNEPWYCTGGLAIVFKIKMKEKFYALKCFYVETNERQERLEHIANYLKQNPSPYFVDFTYLDNELWVETAHGGNGYPVVLMEWVEGKTLDNYLAEICLLPHYHALQNLYFQFYNLAWWLQQQPIAHGDLKHDNIIVTNEGKLKLIDYDGMFVPTLQGRKANEQGSPCYQHPQRDAYYFNEHLDDFSILILQITLLALKQDPSLFKAHYNGDGILLQDTDFSNFAQSSIKAHLLRLDDVKIPLLLNLLQSNLHKLGSIDLVPLLQDIEWINWLVEGQKDGKWEFERERLKELILGDSEWRTLSIKQIRRFHSLNENLLEKYKNMWDWESLSKREGLPWTIDLIEKFKDRWDWGVQGLSGNIGLPWTIELIERFKDRWDWGDSKYLGLIHNEGLSWTIDLIETFIDRWDWKELSSNTKLPWTTEFIEKFGDRLRWRELSWNTKLLWKIDLIKTFADRWDWKELSNNSSLHWTVNFIETFADRWDWKELSNSSSLPWTINFIETFADRWDWEELSNNSSLPWTISLIGNYKDKWNWWKLSGNSGVSWTIDLIEKYRDRINWIKLRGNNNLKLSIDLIEKYKDKWNWVKLSYNTNLPWSRNLIEKYKSSWNWEGLSINTTLPWTVELIESYKDKWNWWSLSRNEGLPWTIDLIDKYEDRWDWEILSRNTNLPWTIDLIDKYEDRWDWVGTWEWEVNCETYGLIRNEGIQWTIDLIEKYKNRWNWYELSKYSNIYEKVLSPLLDDVFIEEVILYDLPM